MVQEIVVVRDRIWQTGALPAAQTLQRTLIIAWYIYTHLERMIRMVSEESTE